MGQLKIEHGGMVSSFLHFMSILFYRVLLPLKVINLEKGTFFLWCLFSIVAGLLGPIINIANNCCFNDLPMALSVLEDSKAGTFYTFSIVLIASAIGSLFLNLLDSSDSFKKIKLYFMALCIFPLFFGGIFYSSFTQKQKEELKASFLEQSGKTYPKNTTLTDVQIIVDKKQLVLFLMALGISVYAFCLQYMNANPAEFEEIRDSYLDREQSGLKSMNQAAGADEGLGDIVV
jgi:hypothetical protein